MKTFDVVIKNWRTGEVMVSYAGVTHDELKQLEASHHQYAPSAWDLEFTEA